MIGAIIGDIVGSPYEFHNIKTKEFELFCDRCVFTDDTILTCAVAEWLTDDKSDAKEMLLKWGKRYQNRTYENGSVQAFGKGFTTFLETEEQTFCKTNGCVMRLSPFFKAFEDKEQALKKAFELTKITHNHLESFQAVGAYIETGFLLKKKVAPEMIKNYIGHKYAYDLSKSVDDIRPIYNKFYCTCKNSVPQAIVAALDANSFEDALRNAVSLGGDSDTLAAMAGGLAEIRFCVPKSIRAKALEYLDDDVLKALNDFEKKFSKKSKFMMLFQPKKNKKVLDI